MTLLLRLSVARCWSRGGVIIIEFTTDLWLMVLAGNGRGDCQNLRKGQGRSRRSTRESVDCLNSFWIASERQLVAKWFNCHRCLHMPSLPAGSLQLLLPRRRPTSRMVVLCWPAVQPLCRSGLARNGVRQNLRKGPGRWSKLKIPNTSTMMGFWICHRRSSTVMPWAGACCFSRVSASSYNNC